MRRWVRRRRETMLTCHEVAAVLQPYIDGETDDVTAARVRRHLTDCRRCGMEEATYLALKESLARRSAPDAAALERLRAFGAQVAEDPPTGDVAPA
jgi:anti-sigma factor RsiW